MSAVSVFDSHKYGPVFAELLERDRLRPLDAGAPAPSDGAALEAASLEAAFAHTSVADEAMARCCLSGLWLLCDFLDDATYNMHLAV